jgi:acyl carrier protein
MAVRARGNERIHGISRELATATYSPVSYKYTKTRQEDKPFDPLESARGLSGKACYSGGMSRQEFLAVMDELMEMPPGSLKGPELIDEMEGWNSIAMVGFIALADEHFGYIVSPRNFASCRTVDDLLNLIKPLQAA